MEQKLVRVPFDLELAKKITNGSVSGRVVTANGRNARIICWDRKCAYYPISALVEQESGYEEHETYTSNGDYSTENESDLSLMLEIPEYMTFKNGDVLTTEDNRTFILCLRENGEFSYYAGTGTENGLFVNLAPLKYVYNNKNKCRRATEEERQKLIDALKASKESKAKEYLKRFFGIEQKQEYGFKPKDWVLTRDEPEAKWSLNIFSHTLWDEGDECYHYYCVGGWSYECIPYNEQTAHLLGTTENWE